MPESILIIEDDEIFREFLQEALFPSQFDIWTAPNVLEGMQKCFEHQPDLILLDLMMPGLNGWQACQRIRDMTDTPIIILTGSPSEDDLEKAVTFDIDGYMIKPVSVTELLAKVKAVLQRTNDNLNNADSSDQVIVVGDLLIDLFSHQVSYNGNPIRLNRTEFKLLVCLAQNQGRILPHRFLLREVWGADSEDNVKLLRTSIYRLRGKLAQEIGNEDMIQVHWKIGYSLEIS
ncbi:MAG: response regulator transcription factor [Chloroflexota bacterium]